MSRKIIIILIFLSFTIILLDTKVAKADSGWDSNYDSDFSYDYGSDYSGRDYNYYDRDYNYYDNYSHNNVGTTNGTGIVEVISFFTKIMIENPTLGVSICIFLTIILFVVAIIILSKPTKKDNSSKGLLQNSELSFEEIKKIDDTLNTITLKEEIFSLYKKVEIAKMQFDNQTLKECLTEELYKIQEQKLKQLKINKQKIVATGITKEEIKIQSIKKLDNITQITAYLHVSQYDYIIDKEKKLIRGTDLDKYQIEYKIIVDKVSDNGQIKYIFNKKECIGKWIKTN